MRLWDVNLPTDLLAAVCAIAGRQFTSGEWKHYVPGQTFQPTC